MLFVSLYANSFHIKNKEDYGLSTRKQRSTQQVQRKEEEAVRVVRVLSERLDKHNENRKEVQDMLHSMCD